MRIRVRTYDPLHHETICTTDSSQHNNVRIQKCLIKETISPNEISVHCQIYYTMKEISVAHKIFHRCSFSDMQVTELY